MEGMFFTRRERERNAIKALACFVALTTQRHVPLKSLVTTFKAPCDKPPGDVWMRFYVRSGANMAGAITKIYSPLIKSGEALVSQIKRKRTKGGHIRARWVFLLPQITSVEKVVRITLVSLKE